MDGEKEEKEKKRVGVHNLHFRQISKSSWQMTAEMRASNPTIKS